MLEALLIICLLLINVFIQFIHTYGIVVLLYSSLLDILLKIFHQFRNVSANIEAEIRIQNVIKH